MEHAMFQDRVDQVLVKEGSTEHRNGFGSGNSEWKLHLFAAHLFQKWMLYDPERRERYFRHVLSNIQNAETQDVSLLLTKTGKMQDMSSNLNKCDPSKGDRGSICDCT